MDIQLIDHLTEKFYNAVSFNQEHFPQVDVLQQLFYGSGKLIDNNVEQPIDFTVQTFIQALMRQIEEGKAEYFVQQEIADKTDIFGNMAQRISTFEYSFIKDTPNWKRGLNYIQYIKIADIWLITSMIWTYEKDRLQLSPGYLP